MAINENQELQLNNAIEDLKTAIMEDILEFSASVADVEDLLSKLKAKVNAMTVDTFNLCIDE